MMTPTTSRMLMMKPVLITGEGKQSMTATLGKKNRWDGDEGVDTTLTVVVMVVRC